MVTFLLLSLLFRSKHNVGISPLGYASSSISTYTLVGPEFFLLNDTILPLPSLKRTVPRPIISIKRASFFEFFEPINGKS